MNFTTSFKDEINKLSGIASALVRAAKGAKKAKAANVLAKGPARSSSTVAISSISKVPKKKVPYSKAPRAQYAKPVDMNRGRHRSFRLTKNK